MIFPHRLKPAINRILPRNRSQRLAAVGALLVVAVAGWFVGLKINPDLAYSHFGIKPAAPKAANGYGYATSLSSLSDSDLDQRLNDMKATGVTWVRYDLSWASVQPDSVKTYDWSADDRITKAATAHGLKVLMILDFVPDWARAKGCDPAALCRPADPTAYAKFAAAAVAHYKPYGVEAWEIWNEPNISYRFEPRVDAAFYTRMLKDAYTAIKRVDSQAVVIAGVTSPSGTDDSGYAPLDFLEAIYAHGGGGYFDAVSAHPYTAPLSPAEAKESDAWGQMSAEHDLMQKHGDGAKQVWITEFGGATNGPDTLNGSVTESFQAQMATEAISLFRSYDWAGPFFWYDYMDAGTSTDTNENFYGLVRADGSHKPAYDTFVKAIANSN